MHKLTVTALIATSISLGGCVSSKENMIPESEYTTQEVYYGQEGGAQAELKQRLVTRRVVRSAELQQDAYMLHNTPRANYELLPNPTLYLYVKEHLSTSDRVPVPSYITEFKMFARDEYALPGETGVVMSR